MIVATRHSGNRQLRFGPNTAIAPGPGVGRVAISGESVTQTTATGLSPIGRAIRLVAGVIATLPIRVWEGQGGDKRERPDSAQAHLFGAPVAGLSTFDWMWDIASALEVEENAFLLKVRAPNGSVLELIPIPAGCVYGYVDRSGNKVFDVMIPGGRAQLSAIEVLHIRGQTIGGGAFGVPRILQHRDPVGAMQAATRFEGSYFRNHARPDIAIVFPGNISREQAREMADNWNSIYQGPENAGKAAPLGGGAQIVPLPLSLKDAQFIEARQFSIEEAGRIMDVDPVLLGATADADTRKAALDVFLKLQLSPRLRRIEGAFGADLDLFTINDPLYPAFKVDDLMFADPLTRAQTEHQRIQDGSSLVDEVRAGRGEPPLPPLPEDWTQEPGKVPQITPVGGASNPTVDTSAPVDEALTEPPEE